MITANVVGQAYALTVLTPIIPGHEELLRDHLEQLSAGPGSPFASLGTTHFARWAVIDQPVYEGPPQKPDALRSQYLLFDSCLDGDRDEYLESIRTLMSAHADAVWEHCVGYPGSSDAEGFADYFRRNQIDASLFMAAYPKATVQDVRVSLALRQRIIDFAVATQELDAQTLLASYREVLMSGIAVSSGAAESS